MQPQIQFWYVYFSLLLNSYNTFYKEIYFTHIFVRKQYAVVPKMRFILNFVQNNLENECDLLGRLVQREGLHTLIVNLYAGNKGYSLAVRNR